MNLERRIHLPALGLATAIALAITLGVPAAMQWDGEWGAAATPRQPVTAVAPAAAPAGLAATKAAAPVVVQAGPASAVEVSIEPRHIEVIGLRPRSLASKPTGHERG